MRIVIDLQGAQTESRFRGIGRYSMGFVSALLRLSSEHDFWVVLNSQFPESIYAINKALEGLLPKKRIRVFEVPRNVAWRTSSRHGLACASEVIREACISELRPDLLLITSLFEGYLDDAVTSVGTLVTAKFPTAVIHYDLIPALYPEYLHCPEISDYYARKLEHLKKADLLLAISNYSRQEAMSFLAMPEDRVVNISAAVGDHLHCKEDSPLPVPASFDDLGIYQSFILCVPGGFDARKNIDALLKAFAQLPNRIRDSHQLVIGSKASNQSASMVAVVAEAAGLTTGEWILTGYLEDDRLRDLYRACKLFVFPSKHEGFGLPLLEAMSLGAPSIASFSTSVGELMANPSYCFDPENVSDISDAMARALEDGLWRDQLAKYALARAGDFSWDRTASLALSAIEEKFGAGSGLDSVSSPPASTGREDIVRAIFASDARVVDLGGDLRSLANCLATNLRAGRQYTLFLDVTELARVDGKSGIQRVVRALLLALSDEPPEGFRVQPIFFDGESFRCANAFSALFFGRDCGADDLADFAAGDHYLSLDLNVASIEASKPILQSLQRRGISLSFLVYDVLPILHPEWWPVGLADGFATWFEVVSQLADRLVCISRVVRDDVADQICRGGQAIKSVSPELAWFHLGADIRNSSPTLTLPRDAEDFFARVGSQITFLMVGTVEPRKGHLLTLDAFESLWAAGHEINLVVIGKRGWLVDELIVRLNSCSEKGRRFFWFDKASDEFLERAYLESTCLIAGSEAEGFGLPLIEASFYDLPVLARDIPVFREVGGEAASYFSGGNPKTLADAILKWVENNVRGQTPDPRRMDVLSWQDSARALVEQLQLNTQN